MSQEQPQQEVCENCFRLNTFGYRDRLSFGLCACPISESSNISKFVNWANTYNLFGNEQLSQNTDFKKLMRKCREGGNLSNLYDEASLQHISHYVCDVCIQHFDTGDIEYWEYLDVGCGNGLVSRRIADDMDVMCQHTDTQDIRSRPLLPDEDEQFEVYDGKRLRHGTGYYKIVTSFFHLHHVPCQSDLIQEIYRVLEPGGLFFIREFDCRGWGEAYALDFRHYLTGEFNTKSEESSRSNPFRFVTCYRSREGWRELIESCGFECLKDLGKGPKGPFREYFDVFLKSAKK